jgi:hypothetical protein
MRKGATSFAILTSTLTKADMRLLPLQMPFTNHYQPYTLTTYMLSTLLSPATPAAAHEFSYFIQHSFS